MKFKHLALFVSILFILTCNRIPRGEKDTINFIIIQMNDVYEIAPLEGGKAGGLARVAAVRQELLQETPNVISILSGDFLSPSFIGTLKMPDGKKIAGLQMVETLNAMGLDYVTFGNHEFDIKDPDLLQERIDQSEFIWTTCNAFRVKNGKTNPFKQKGIDVPNYIIHEFKSPSGKKMKLGLLGVVLPFNQIDYVSYTPVTTSFRDTYKELKQLTDITFAITHLEVDEDISLAAAVPGIPLFIGGHDHVNMLENVGETRIAKADANAKTIYIHRVNYNLETQELKIRSSLKKIDDTIEEEKETKAVVDKWRKNTDQIMANMGYDPDQQLMETKDVLECKEAVVRSRQTNYGQLTVNAFEAAMPGAAVYLINSGSMRLDDDIVGVVTVYDVLRTFPFGGAIAEMNLKGIDLAKMLEAGLEKNQGDGGYFQINNVKKENNAWLINGQALDLNKNYKIVLPEFVAGGGEANLGFLKNFEYQKSKIVRLDGTNLKNDIRDIVIGYMKLR